LRVRRPGPIHLRGGKKNAIKSSETPKATPVKKSSSTLQKKGSSRREGKTTLWRSEHLGEVNYLQVRNFRIQTSKKTGRNPIQEGELIANGSGPSKGGARSTPIREKDHNGKNELRKEKGSLKRDLGTRRGEKGELLGNAKERRNGIAGKKKRIAQ